MSLDTRYPHHISSSGLSGWGFINVADNATSEEIEDAISRAVAELRAQVPETDTSVPETDVDSAASNMRSIALTAYMEKLVTAIEVAAHNGEFALYLPNPPPEMIKALTLPISGFGYKDGHITW